MRVVDRKLSVLLSLAAMPSGLPFSGGSPVPGAEPCPSSPVGGGAGDDRSGSTIAEVGESRSPHPEPEIAGLHSSGAELDPGLSEPVSGPARRGSSTRSSAQGSSESFSPAGVAVFEFSLSRAANGRSDNGLEAPGPPEDVAVPAPRQSRSTHARRVANTVVMRIVRSTSRPRIRNRRPHAHLRAPPKPGKGEPGGGSTVARGRAVHDNGESERARRVPKTVRRSLVPVLIVHPKRLVLEGPCSFRRLFEVSQLAVPLEFVVLQKRKHVSGAKG